jgi:hypothetical protein
VLSRVLSSWVGGAGSGALVFVLLLSCSSSIAFSDFNGIRSMDLRVAVFHVMCESLLVPPYSLPPSSYGCP